MRENTHLNMQQDHKYFQIKSTQKQFLEKKMLNTYKHIQNDELYWK